MSTIRRSKKVAIDDLLTPEQAAPIIGVAERRVQQYCEAGRLGFEVGAGKVRKRYLITRADAESFEPMPTGRPPSVV